jgi:hypothetical protein
MSSHVEGALLQRNAHEKDYGSRTAIPADRERSWTIMRRNMLSVPRRRVPVVWCDRQVGRSRRTAGAALLVGAILINVGAASPIPDFTVDVDPVSLLFPIHGT